jgi:hypothetical protein
MAQDSGAQGIFRLESSIPGGVKASRRETGGVGGKLRDHPRFQALLDRSDVGL